MNLAANVDQALRAANIPIVGVSIGRKNDKATWRVDFDGEPTADQRAHAQRIIDDFDPAAVVEPQPVTIEDLDARLRVLEAREP